MHGWGNTGKAAFMHGWNHMAKLCWSTLIMPGHACHDSSSMLAMTAANHVAVTSGNHIFCHSSAAMRAVLSGKQYHTGRQATRLYKG
jgi:hypothetical protein